MTPADFRRAILLALVLLAVSSLYGCGITTYHQLWDAHDALNSPEMNARIAEATK